MRATFDAGSARSGTPVLGIETSCDETAAAVVSDGRRCLSSIVSSQVDVHARFGGVVPEIASRAHLELLTPVVEEALDQAAVSTGGGAVGGTGAAPVSAIAATTGPGLIGSLLVGVSHAKALALVWRVPFVGVNHLEAHLYAPWLEDDELEMPLVVLLVSGGHTMLVSMEDHGRYRLLGETIDDAAGEAFDKVARFLGLGYPGGPAIDKAAARGDPEAIRFPRALMEEGLDFSFSGLKTSVVTYVRSHPDVSSEDVAACFQEAVVDVLVKKTLRAAEQQRASCVCLTGGVAANSLLRRRFLHEFGQRGVRAAVPGRDLCTDNAAMVAAAGWWALQREGPSSLAEGAHPDLALAAIR